MGVRSMTILPPNPGFILLMWMVLMLTADDLEFPLLVVVSLILIWCLIKGTTALWRLVW